MKKQNKQAGEFQEDEACGEQPVLLPSNATNECKTIPVQMVQKLADMLIDTKAAKEEAVRESERYRKENADLARRLEQSEWEKEQIRAECQAIKRASAVYLAERLAPSPPQQAAESPGMPDGTESAEAPLSEMEGKINRAIAVMQEEKIFKFAYDYVWVMLVMNQTAGMPHFESTPSFHCFLGRIGVKEMPTLASLKKKATTARRLHPGWTFADTADVNETRRRNNVASRFLSLVRKAA